MGMLVIITGSSRGFGRALLNSCENLNFDVVGLCRKPVLKNELECDLSDENSYKNVIERVLKFKNEIACKKEFKKVVILHNAGSVGPVDKKFSEITSLETNFKNYLEVNLVSFASLTQQLIKNCSQSELLFVNVSSLCAKVAMPSLNFYCTGKAARNMFFECLVKEYEKSDTGIKFLNYAPGPLDTDMYKTIEDESASDCLRNQFGESRKAILTVDQSCKVLMKLIFPEKFDEKFDGEYRWESGDHVDYFDVVESDESPF